MRVSSAQLKSIWTKVPDGLMHSITNSHLLFQDTPTVVLVHGLVISSAYMRPTAEYLVPLCQVYAVDLPGYGKSYKPRNVLSLPELADALADWMDALKIPKAHLIANSFGCQILAEFAIRYPQRVNRLVLQGPTIDSEARTFWQQFIRSLLNSRNEPSSLTWITIKDYKSAGLRRAWATVKLAMEDRVEEKLPKIHVPTLVVRGGKDPIVPQRWAEEVTRLLPQGELRVIPDVGHTINYSAPLEFVSVIKPFLQL